MNDLTEFRDAYLADRPWPPATSRYVYELSNEILRLQALLNTRNNIALCKCGIDMSVHSTMRDWEELESNVGFVLPENEHYFDAAGTKHRCEELINTAEGVWMCPRPAYHSDENVPCGPLTGEKLW